TIYGPGGVQWNTGENAVDVGDQECGGNPLADTSCIYSVSVSGSTGSIVGTTALNNGLGTPSCDIVQTVRMSNFLYGGDTEFASQYPYFECASGGPPNVFSGEYRWLFPAGGNPNRHSTNSMSEPDGVAISK
ncbi:MAG TPA: hypothetical protein VEW74_02190, partial [Candidatus Nitrosotalea sp.]|nr:hypothetical protein [Candidatus Nitrosotalea sp.]